MERWIAGQDEPGDWTFEWKLLGVDGGRAFVQGRTDYRGDSRSYDNLWIIQLAGDGRATAFTEWYMPRTGGRLRLSRGTGPGPGAAPAARTAGRCPVPP